MPRFVVQRHRARRLHYDFRLEIDGVLVSWAVPKGPTLDPAVRRAAFHVDDHPLSYIDFEGVLPAGRYGAGDVIVWDNGTWHPKPGTDPTEALAAGELHLDLQGKKLRGRFVLIRTRTPASGKDEWLLLHKRDTHAVPGWNPEDHPRSVLSARTNEDLARNPHPTDPPHQNTQAHTTTKDHKPSAQLTPGKPQPRPTEILNVPQEWQPPPPTRRSAS